MSSVPVDLQSLVPFSEMYAKILEILESYGTKFNPHVFLQYVCSTCMK